MAEGRRHLTPAKLARARELLNAWQKGAAREGDLAELLGLLPKVLEAAERLNKAAIALMATPGIDAFTCEAEQAYDDLDKATW
jgi:hypothetical protein